MKLNSLVSAILSVSLSFCCLSLALAQVTLTDGDFDAANWQDIVYLNDTGTSLTRAIRVASDGNPGAHREMAFQWNTSGGSAAIYVYSRFLNATYNPSTQGAITTIDYSEDGRVTSDSAGANSITLPARMGLEQGGIIYRSRVVSVVQNSPFPGDWTNLALSGLRAGNFIKGDDTVPGPDNPDFSASGGVINLGYIRANSNHLADREIVTSIDNWSVTINQAGDAAHTISKVVLDDSGAGITTAEVGDIITYRVTFTNTGGVAITGVEVTDTLPDNLQYVSATATPTNSGVAFAPGPPATVIWPVGAVAAGASARLDIDMEILAGADQQALTNQATVSAVDAPAVAGQTASVDLHVGTPLLDVAFSSFGVDDDWYLAEGAMYMEEHLDIIYDFTITNTGPGFANDVVTLRINDLTVKDTHGDISGFNTMLKRIESADGLNCDDDDDSTYDYDITTLPKECTLDSLNQNESIDIQIVVYLKCPSSESIPDLLIDYDFELVNANPDPFVSYSQVQDRTEVGGTGGLLGGGGGGGGCFISSAWNQSIGGR